MSEPLFPAFLKLSGRKVLLIGAGPVALGKLEGLLAAGAKVTVVAPRVGAEFARDGVAVLRRTFEPEDLRGAWLAVAAAPAAVNRQVAQAAEERQVFVNAVDDPQSGSVYTGGVLRRGGVTLAVSTEGQAPALAGLLREALESVLPDELEAWVQQAAALRATQRAAGVALARRRPMLLDALNELYADRPAAGTELRGS